MARYSDPNPARVALARGLGVVGILASLALAVFAFAPKSDQLAGKFGTLSSRVSFPWDPKLEPGPPSLPLDRGTLGAVIPVRSSGVDAGEAASPFEASSAPPAATIPAVGLERPAAPESVAAPVAAAPALATPTEAPVDASRSTDTSPAAVARVEAPAPKAEPKPARVQSRPVESYPRTSEGFTEEEIQQRRDRYEAWLAEQGLERIQ